MDVTPEKLNVPQSMEEMEKTILSNMGKLCGLLSKSGADPAKIKEVEEVLAKLPTRFTDEKKQRDIKTKLNEFRRNLQLIKLRLLLEKAESVQKIAENANKKLIEEMEKLPKPKIPEIAVPKKTPPKTAKPTASLLAAQQLRDEILKKIQELQTPPPRTTGNIWENWKQDHPESPPSSNQNDKDKKS